MIKTPDRNHFYEARAAYAGRHPALPRSHPRGDGQPAGPRRQARPRQTFRHPRRHAHALQGPAQGDGGRRHPGPHPQDHPPHRDAAGSDRRSTSPPTPTPTICTPSRRSGTKTRASSRASTVVMRQERARRAGARRSHPRPHRCRATAPVPHYTAKPMKHPRQAAPRADRHRADRRRRRAPGAGRPQAQGNADRRRRSRRRARRRPRRGRPAKLSGRLMIPKAKVVAVIGNPQSEGAVSMIAIHNLEIPYRFPASVLKEAEAAGEASLKGREDWRHIPAHHHRSAGRQGPRRRGPCRARHRPEESPAAISSPSRSPMSPPMCGRARRSTAKPICAAIRSISPTASCRCCPSASRTISAR